jgi:hypothetical protein
MTTYTTEKLRTPFGDQEAKIGLIPLEELLHERDDLVLQVSKLRARHGTFGVFDAERKIALASAAALIRAQAALESKKITESAIDEGAHTHPTYVEFIAKAVTEKAEWVILEAKIEGIDFTIRRGDVIGRYLAQEVALAR